MNRSTAPKPYIARLEEDLATIKRDLDDLLDISSIRPVDPDLITPAKWRWARSNDAVTVAQMALLEKYTAWFNRFLLLFPHPTREITTRIGKVDEFVRTWVARDRGHVTSIPGTTLEAKEVAGGRLAAFDDLLQIPAQRGDRTLRLLPDTNALLRNPSVEEYAAAVGSKSYMVHILTPVLAELDDLKDRGRTQDVREKAEKVVRRLKGFRDRGSLAEGIVVAGNIRLRLEHREVDARSVLSWLDPTVPDDRIIGGALRLQSDHPAGVVVLITADINLQNKADAVGLAFAEPPVPVMAGGMGSQSGSGPVV